MDTSYLDTWFPDSIRNPNWRSNSNPCNIFPYVTVGSLGWCLVTCWPRHVYNPYYYAFANAVMPSKQKQAMKRVHNVCSNCSLNNTNTHLMF